MAQNANPGDRARESLPRIRTSQRVSELIIHVLAPCIAPRTKGKLDHGRGVSRRFKVVAITTRNTIQTLVMGRRLGRRSIVFLDTGGAVS